MLGFFLKIDVKYFLLKIIQFVIREVKYHEHKKYKKFDIAVP